MTHTCHAEGCTQIVPPRMFACLPHWRMVPQPLRAALWRVYRPGQEIRKDPTPQYLFAQALCVIAIGKREGKPTPGAVARVRSTITGVLNVDVSQVDDERLIELGMSALGAKVAHDEQRRGGR